MWSILGTFDVTLAFAIILAGKVALRRVIILYLGLTVVGYLSAGSVLGTWYVTLNITIFLILGHILGLSLRITLGIALRLTLGDAIRLTLTVFESRVNRIR